MRTKILIQTFILLAIPVIFYFTVSGFKTFNETEKKIDVINTAKPTTLFTPKDFTNFILNESYGHDDTVCDGENWNMENFFDKYRGELSFNGVHLYDFDGGTSCMGIFNQPLRSYQISKVNSLISGAHNNGLKAIYQRSNLSMLCTAQRLVYEVTQPSGNTTTNYGFCYGTTAGEYVTETDGTTALHLPDNTQNSAVCMAQNIYENLQHTDLPEFQWRDRDNWHLKPRMKIRLQDFDINDTRPVVTIKAYSFNGTLIDSKTIRVRNFEDGNGQYNGGNGGYIDNFIFRFEPSGTNLTVSGGTNGGLSDGWNSHWENWDTDCHVDFKIYWEGNVDVWFDKLTVDDDRANVMFAPSPNNYNQFIQAELDNFATDEPIMDMFFCDEVVHSQIPASKYIVDYIRANGPEGTKIIIANTNYLNIHGLKNNTLGFKPFVEAVHPDYLQTDVHSFFGWRDEGTNTYHENYYPNTITPTDGMVPSAWSVSKSTYNDWLQNNILGDKNTITTDPNNLNDPGSFIYQVNLARTDIDTYSEGTRFIMQPQIHGFLYDYDGIGGSGEYDTGLREPLDEEYSVQAMVSIAHGAEGLSWFWFQSFHWSETSQMLRTFYTRTRDHSVPNNSYCYGLINTDAGERHENMWGQNKWQDIGATNEKILKWKPTLDAINWAAGYSIHSEYLQAFANTRYIADIKSIYRNNSSPFNFSPENLDATNARYWELGYYDPNLDGDFSQYFIFVNRRCIPETENYEGDARQLKVKFNGSNLAAFNN